VAIDFFLTAYDPSDLPGASIDPLGFERGYLFLADKILPGLTNVAARPRYFGVLCAGVPFGLMVVRPPPNICSHQHQSMRLERLSVSGFRSYREPAELSVAGLTAIIGKNDAGKSTLLEALAIFFDEMKMDSGDFSVGTDAHAVIECAFSSFPSSIVLDANVSTSLGEELLLDENGLLCIRKQYTRSEQPKPKISAVAVHPTASGVADLMSLKNVDLKHRATDVGANLNGVDAKINAQLRKAIRDAVPDHKLQRRPVDLNGEDGKQVWEAIASKLPTFALFRADRPSTDQDAEAQDPLRAAVKAALVKQEQALNEIVEKVRAEVLEVMEATIDRLAEMDAALATALIPNFPQPKWDSLFKPSLADESGISINKRGSGVRRLVLLNFFRASTETLLASESRRSLIYAIEEPETSQHPRNQAMLLNALEELVSSGAAQVMFTTHTPNLARRLPLDALRYVAVDPDGSRRIQMGTNELFGDICSDLGIHADHRVRLFVGVEGPNDIAFLTGISTSLRSTDASIPDIEASVREGRLMFVPLGGSTLAVWCDRLAALNRPEIYIVDRDEEPPLPSKYGAQVAAWNARANCSAFETTCREMENFLHPDAIAAARPGVTVTWSAFADIPGEVARCTHEADAAAKPWASVSDENRSKKRSRAKQWLNAEASRHMNAERLAETDPSGELVGWLRAIAAHL
jgi:putative ATP-dependent endonuclease of the OLD family